MALTFDEVLELAKPGGPVPYFCKAWKREVFLRDPTTEDFEAFRTYCQEGKKRGNEVFVSAFLVQRLLCDAQGQRIIPEGEEALAKLVASKGGAVFEIGEAAAKLITPPTNEEVDNEKKE